MVGLECGGGVDVGVWRAVVEDDPAAGLVPSVELELERGWSFLDDLQLSRGMDLESAVGLGEFVNRRISEGLDGLGLDRGGVDGGAVAALGFEEEEVWQKALALGIGGVPGVLNSGEGDSVGDL